MKITRIETFDTKYVGFVRITAEDGSIGWGQVSTYNSDITCQVLPAPSHGRFRHGGLGSARAAGG